MKRALAAAIFGGLAFVVPQAAFADHSGDHKADCAGQPAGTTESPEQAPPPQQREGEHSDGGEILF